MEQEISSSKFTAIKRNKLSAPVKKLLELSLLNKNSSILDLGCGREDDIKYLKKRGFNIVGFDPNWSTNEKVLERKYDIVLCTYVFCVVPYNIRADIMRQIQELLKADGEAFISVRRDICRTTKTKKGTTQYPVYLGKEKIYENSDFCIYKERKQNGNETFNNSSI